MKKWWKSKTVIVNALVLLVGVVGYVAGHDVISQYPDVIAGLVALQGAINVVLRFISWKRIG